MEVPALPEFHGAPGQQETPFVFSVALFYDSIRVDARISTTILQGYPHFHPALVCRICGIPAELFIGGSCDKNCAIF